MLVVMNSHATEKDIQRVAMFIESKGFEANKRSRFKRF